MTFAFGHTILLRQWPGAYGLSCNQLPLVKLRSNPAARFQLEYLLFNVVHSVQTRGLFSAAFSGSMLGWYHFQRGVSWS